MIPVWLLPYLPRAIGGFVLFCALAGTIGFIHHEHSAAIERTFKSGYDKAGAEFAAQVASDTAKRRAENAATAAQENRISQSVEVDHAQALQDLQTKLHAARAAAAAAGGLRLPAAACQSAGRLPTAAASASGDHDAVAGTVALPDQIETDLFDSAWQADQIIETARACQNWIRKEGLYKAP